MEFHKIDSWAALVAEVALEAGEAVALARGQVALVRGRAFRVTLTLAAAPVGVVAPGSLGALFAGLALSQRGADTPARVRVANVSGFFTWKAFCKDNDKHKNRSIELTHFKCCNLIMYVE
jgi:Na+/glutamate symporter